MANYTVTWSDIPLEQYWALPEQARQLVDDRIVELRPNPIRDLETYNRDTDHWTVDYGNGAGLLVYVASAERQRIIILRLIHFA